MEVLLEVLASEAHHEVGVQVDWEADGRQAEPQATGGDALRALR